MSFDLLDRRRGTLIGLAVGDALGAAVEFQDPGTFPKVVGYRDGGAHRLAAGEWTDDTSMALALADSIGRGWDLDDQVRQYVAWRNNGRFSVTGRCFDIGLQTSRALSAYEQSGDVRSCAGRSDDRSGNGSIMRLAPVPVRYADLYPGQIEKLAHLADESSIPTHASEQCRSACRYMALLLSALMHGEPRDEVLSGDWSRLKELESIAPLDPAIREVASGSFRRREPPEIAGGGWVVKSLEAALWAFHKAFDFHEAVLSAVNLGDDADTTGAVCGQFAGAYWGEQGIPGHWRRDLGRPEMIEAALESCAAGQPGR
jgi:ADP-ribosylglycohydrolase